MALIAVIVALLFGAEFAVAQDSTGVDRPRLSQAACDSVLAGSTADSARVGVRLLLSVIEGGPLPAPHPGVILQELAMHLVLPRPLRVPVFSPPPLAMRTLRVVPADTPLRQPTLNGTYAFTLHDDASVTRPRVVRPSLVPGLDSAVLAAITATGDSRALIPFGEDIPVDSVTLRLRLTSDPESGGLALDLFAAMFPRLPVTDAELVARGPPPEFPAEERRLKLTGEALFQVVLGIDGQPELSTLELLRATTLGFADAAFAVIPRLRWSPAHVGACAVPQLVNIPIHFRNP